MPTRSTLVSVAFLIVLLSAGAAQSLSGSNTVFTDDIAPGAVTFSDIKENAVTSSRIANSGVFGGDIANDSLTGADINEATIPGFKRILIAQVNSAGALVSGDATSASRNDTGEYTVTFAQPLAACTATAGGASFPGYDQYAFDVRATTSVRSGSSSVVVRLRTGSGTAVTSSFVVMVACG